MKALLVIFANNTSSKRHISEHINEQAISIYFPSRWQCFIREKISEVKRPDFRKRAIRVFFFFLLPFFFIFWKHSWRFFFFLLFSLFSLSFSLGDCWTGHWRCCWAGKLVLKHPTTRTWTSPRPNSIWSTESSSFFLSFSFYYWAVFKQYFLLAFFFFFPFKLLNRQSLSQGLLFPWNVFLFILFLFFFFSMT